MSAKLLLWPLFIVLTMGFRVWHEFRWQINHDEPHLWIKLCPGDEDLTYKVPPVMQDDVLASSGTDPNLGEVIQTIMDDFNSVKTSFVFLESYPFDLDNIDPNSNFDLEASKERTIDLCFATHGGTQGGGAAVEFRSGVQVGCNITIDPKYKKDLKAFVRVTTHELGHCLGLAHPQETSHAIMSYFTTRDKVRLQTDDLMGVTHLYPARIKGISYVEKTNLGLKCDVAN